MEIEEIIGILIGTGSAPGLIYVVVVLIKKLNKAYTEEKRRGLTSLQALNAAVRSLSVRGSKGKRGK